MKLKGKVINAHEHIVSIELLEVKEFHPNQWVELQYKTKDVNQELRGLFWLLMKFLADELGYDRSQDVYIVLKDHFGMYDVIVGLDHKAVKNYHSTKNGEIDTKELGAFFEKIQRWAVEMNINIEPFISQWLQIRRERGKD